MPPAESWQVTSAIRRMDGAVVTDDEAGGEDCMVGRDGRVEQMPSESLKG